jgi:Domain of unknown function (DUF222)
VNPVAEPREDAGGPAEPGFAWLPGSVEGSPAPYGLDYQALLEALAAGGLLSGRSEDQDAVAAEEAAAVADGRMSAPLPTWRLAAMAVEHMPPGPAQAGWLAVAAGAVDRLDEYALAGVAIAARQLSSWASAAELGAGGQIMARSAAADRKIGLEDDGRPVRLCRDGVSQLAFALLLTDYGANALADLGVTLTWRLPDTGKALAAGSIDLDRARLIADATSVLGEKAAREVEAKVLPHASRETRAQLQRRLRYAVIEADPEGAERRRRAAERDADVRLYAEDDQTATLIADKLPQVEGAAGYARLNALARARVAAGCPGGLRLNRTQVLLGMLLGSLPPIPPAEGSPPDDPPPPRDPGSGDRGAGGDHPGSGGPGDGGPGDGGPGDGGPPPPEDLPDPRDEDAPPEDGLDEAPAVSEDAEVAPDPVEEGDDDPRATGPEPVWPSLGAIPPALGRPAGPAGVPDGRSAPGLLDVLVPWLTMVGASNRPGLLGRIGPITPVQARQLCEVGDTDPGTQLRVIVTNAAGQAITVTRIRRRARDRGSRDGPGRPPPGRPPPGRPRPGAPRPGSPPPGSGLVSRLTLTITEDTMREMALASAHGGGPGPPGGMAGAVVKAAVRALDRAAAQAEADATAGGCAHHGQSTGYRPPPRLREHVIARDVTCRSPVCRQPAWRADLDHTVAYDRGGRTCSCNLGGACRRDHQLKQHPRWKLEQTRPGYFTWTAPGGRTYAVGPDIQPV